MRIPLVVVALATVVPALASAVVFAASRDPGPAPTAQGPTCIGERATLIGTPGPDRLKATPHRDVIVAAGGADRINALGGADLVCGGPGADRVFGGPGRDQLRGEGGDDRLDGGSDRDRCDGGAGANTLTRCETPGVQQTAPINRAPSAGTPSVTTDELSVVEFDLLAAASDPDGDAVAVESIDTAGAIGTVSLRNGRIASFDPAGRFASLAAGESAETSFGLTVGDGRGLTSSARATVTVTGIDDDPVAVDDSASLQQDDPATPIDVLANDTDVDGGPRSIESVEQPSDGTVVIGTDPSSLTYEPDPGYCNDGEGADAFTYSLAGGSSATVAVAVACVTTISTDAQLEPGYDPAIHDYTVHCDGASVDVSGRTDAGSSVAVDGGASTSGEFEAEVPLEENQEFEFTVDAGAGPQSYFVRCLPADFPTWEYEGLKTPSHQFYVTAPTLISGSAPPYAVVFDGNGVPVWWYANRPAGPIDAKVLADGNVAWWSEGAESNGYEIRKLNGDLVRTVEIVGGSTDIHELQQEPNGDFLLMSYQPREHIDLTQFGGGVDQTVIDGVVQEIGPDGELVWEWSTEGHIGLDETGRWWPTALAGNGPRDIVHMNAIEPVGDDAILISLRHTDAVYKIDKATGAVIWKLGGTWTPKSLTVVGDPEGAYPLGGQHDVRLLADGTITIYDNNTNQPSPPRAVRYEIDEVAHKATMVEQVTDPLAPSSFCCGSARRSADGSWLFSWGGRSLVTEFNAAEERTFKLSFVPGGVETGIPVFSYRAVAAPDGILTAAALRAGMNSMHPR